MLVLMLGTCLLQRTMPLFGQAGLVEGRQGVEADGPHLRLYSTTMSSDVNGEGGPVGGCLWLTAVTRQDARSLEG